MSETNDVSDTCADLVEAVTSYLEGGMTAPERATFEAHLAACPPCEVYLEQMRTTIRETGGVGNEDLPEGFCDNLVAAFKKWHDESGTHTP